MKHFAFGCIATTLATSVCSAAIFTVDLRVEDTQGKTATVNAAGESVVLGVYLVVANANNNHADDGFTSVRGGILSVDSGLLGDVSSMTFGPAVEASLSSGGTPTNLDANADLELGGTNPNSNTGFIYATSGVTERFGTGVGTSATEFKLGTVSWTALNAVGTASLNFFLQPRTTLTGSNPVVWARSDGTDSTMRFDDAKVGVGAPVVISVPEPASLGLLSAAACALLRRQRNR